MLEPTRTPLQRGATPPCGCRGRSTRPTVTQPSSSGSTSPCVAHWVESVRVSADGVWDTGFQFGDWLDPAAPPDDPARAKADPGVVATACFARSAAIVAEVAEVLGQDEDTEPSTEALAGRRARRPSARVRRPDRHDRSDCRRPTPSRSSFDLLDETSERPPANAWRSWCARAATGSRPVSSARRYVMRRAGPDRPLDAAYELLLQRECPSWLYPVTMGATTIWERWDSLLPDGSSTPAR